MKNRSITYLILLGVCSMLTIMQSCQKTDDLESDINDLKDRVTALESAIEGLNTSFASLQALMQKNKVIIGVTPTKDGKGYSLELSDGTTIEVMESEEVKASIPEFSVDAEGYWVYKTASDTKFQYMPGPNGEEKVSAIPRDGDDKPIVNPQLSVSSDGYWQVSYDNGKTYTSLGTKAEGGETGGSSIFSKVEYDEAKREFTFTLAGTDPEQSYTFPVDNAFDLIIEGLDLTKTLEFASGEQFKEFTVQQKDIKEAMIQKLQGWQVQLSETKLLITPLPDAVKDQEETIKIVLTSSKNYIRIISIKVKALSQDGNTLAWTEFKKKSENNVLLDFSYAGYKHGEVAPPEASEFIAKGYKLYDISNYGAIANDGKSDREAFIKLLEDMGATRGADADAIRYQMKGNVPANAVIYFPEGEYILQGEGETNTPLRLTMGNLIIKGAGRSKTTIKMAAANTQTKPDQMWSTPVMLEIKHNSGLSDIANITADASQGSSSVAVSSTTGISKGDWVCLTLVNNSPELIAQELAPYSANSSMTNLTGTGIQIYDYHQVKSISGNTVTFEEPLMHGVEQKWNWKLQKYPHYENVGVEDLTFKGEAKSDFMHHRPNVDGADDGAYKLIDMVRLTNSWMRRVNFVSVSEASSITSCANVSVYDIHIGGNRGHAAIRSQASSRVFIGKVIDESNGYEAIKDQVIGTELIKGAGQYHACGVSKQSMGAVIWNVQWGKDACFESHATQPRATLIDRCSGSFMPWRQGGDRDQMPNHMENLTIWNMNASNVKYDDSWGGKFKWWDDGPWWKILKPIIVGFHGSAINFDADQIVRNENPGSPVEPYSLYEAQLRLRLGYVPAWLNSLK